MSLYPDQLKAAADFEEWLTYGTDTTAGLWASAGYGKSYCVKHLITEVVRNSKYNALVTSMTHSAVAVLSDFTGMPVQTLHSLMGWIPHVDKDTGEESLSTPKQRDRNAKSALDPSSLVIVDEAGLLGHTELKYLLRECAETGARVLFVGDSKQCYPVMKDTDKLCIPAYDATECMMELTEPKRVDEKDVIFKLSQAFRATVDGARQPKLRTVMVEGKGVTIVDDIEDAACDAFMAAENRRMVKVLAFTNQRCLTLNRKIRKRVLGVKDQTPLVGEEMVANTSIEDATRENVIIRNNQLVIVKSVEPTESFGLQGSFIQFVDLDGEEIPETVFVASTTALLNSRLKDLANAASKAREEGDKEASSKYWRAYFSLKESVADVRFTYAMTVNKAQGTTLNHVLVDLWDINACHDESQKARLAYTAVTRATNLVTIEGELT